jgi:type I restriction enzyme, S subunit
VTTNRNALPVGWAATTLSEVRVDRSTTVDPSGSPDEHFELYSIPAFPTGLPEIVAGRAIGSTKQSLIPGTVVVSKINPRINRVWVVGDHSSHPKIGSSEWIPFFPIDGIGPQYLAYYMRRDDFRNYLAAHVSGVGGSLMRVRPATLDPYPIVIAPESEQRRIVAALESYLTRLDAAVATLERVQRSLKRYRASVLKAAVEGRLVPTEAKLARAEVRNYEPASVLLTRILAERRRRWEEAELAKMTAKGKAPKDDEWKAKYAEPIEPYTTELPQLPEGWCWASVDQLFDARLGKMLDGEKNTGSLRPYLRNANVRWFAFDLADVKEMRIEDAELDDVSVRFGDLVVCEGGEPGRAAVWTIPSESFVIQKACHRLRPYSGVDPHFFSFVLATEAKSGRLSKAFTGSTIKHLTGVRLYPFVVPLPPVMEQARIVAEAERILSITDSLERETAARLEQLARLRQSILQWAFGGRLVDQDPTDQPASALLERIRAERGTPPRRARREKARTPKP